MTKEVRDEDYNLWNQLKEKYVIKVNAKLNSLINLLYLPKDASSLGVIRCLYGTSFSMRFN